MKRLAFLGIVTATALSMSACSQGEEEIQPVDEPAGVEESSSDGPPPPPETDTSTSMETTSAPVESAAVIDGIKNERLSFASGTSSARIEGSITGGEIIDYLLNVRAGQAMNISMGSQNASAYFNLLEPGETEVAVFNGSMNENMFEGTAKKSGDYRIRVYLFRNAARRNEKADYVLEAIVN